MDPSKAPLTGIYWCKPRSQPSCATTCATPPPPPIRSNGQAADQAIVDACAKVVPAPRAPQMEHPCHNFKTRHHSQRSAVDDADRLPWCHVWSPSARCYVPVIMSKVLCTKTGPVMIRKPSDQGACGTQSWCCSGDEAAAAVVACTGPARQYRSVEFIRFTCMLCA